MSKIKYYALSRDESLPDEFCAIRNINGEPEEYVFYVRDSEVAGLRELCETMLRCIVAGRGRDCWSCPAHRKFDELRHFCYIKDDAAKLGIGVVD